MKLNLTQKGFDILFRLSLCMIVAVLIASAIDRNVAVAIGLTGLVVCVPMCFLAIWLDKSPK